MKLVDTIMDIIWHIYDISIGSRNWYAASRFSKASKGAREAPTWAGNDHPISPHQLKRKAYNVRVQ